MLCIAPYHTLPPDKKCSTAKVNVTQLNFDAGGVLVFINARTTKKPISLFRWLFLSPEEALEEEATVTVIDRHGGISSLMLTNRPDYPRVP